MAIHYTKIHWGLIIIGVVIAFLIAYGSSIVMVTGYATYLAFQVRGAPDTTMINAFAAQYAGGITVAFIGVGTLIGGLRAGRKATTNSFQHGLLVGLTTALIDLALGFFGSFSVWAIVSVALAVAGGLLAGKLSSR